MTTTATDRIGPQTNHALPAQHPDERPTQTPVRRHPPRILFLVVNPLLKLLLRVPVALPIGRDLLLLTFTGRKSGKRYSTPVGYYRQRDQQGEVLDVFTDAKWWRNLRDGKPVMLHLMGRAVPAAPEIVRDRAVMVRILQEMQRTEDPKKAKRLRFILGLNPELEPTDADLHAALGGKATEKSWLLIRLRPVGA